MNVGEQILKTRDDKSPVSFKLDEKSLDVRFKLPEGEVCAWSEPSTSFGPETLRPRVEPWLTSLFQSEHLALLVGSGLTHAVHQMATGIRLPGMSRGTFSEFANQIDVASKASATAAGRDEGNIEDQIRVANELIRGLDSPDIQNGLVMSAASQMKPAKLQAFFS